jgi:hypothetical protein
MKRSLFSEEQIVYALLQAESGTPAGSSASLSTAGKKYLYLGVIELRRLR